MPGVKLGTVKVLLLVCVPPTAMAVNEKVVRRVSDVLTVESGEMYSRDQNP